MTTPTRHAEILAIMQLAPVIPVLTVSDVEDGVAQARALVAGGLLRDRGDAAHPAALDAIAAIATRVPGAHVGAGTIVEPAQIDEAVEAGATFLVSPGASPRLADAAAAAPVPFLPGVATPSEAMALRDRGFRALKLFPAEAVGGAGCWPRSPRRCPISCSARPAASISAKAPAYLALPNVQMRRRLLDAAEGGAGGGRLRAVEALAREAAGLALRAAADSLDGSALTRAMAES